MKKSLLLTPLLLLMLNVIPVSAEETDQWNFDEEYYVLQGYSGPGGDVTVPGQIGDGTVDVIGSDAFKSTDITSLTLPDTLLQLRDCAISWCDHLESVSLPESLVAINPQNFWMCDALTDITIPAGVRFIGDSAFYHCNELRKVTFTGLCPVIGQDCFVSIPDDAVIYVPDDQLEAYQTALEAAGCTVSVQASGQNAVIVDNNGYTEGDFDFDASTGTITSYNGFATYLSIPDTIGGTPVKAIGSEAFWGHYYLTVLELPEGLESIGEGAFSHCQTLYDVDFPSTLKSIGDKAFYTSYFADSLHLESVETIGDYAFEYSRISGELTLPESLVSIGAGAFADSRSLEELYLPASVEHIGAEAFGNISGLNYVYMDGLTLPVLDENAFAGCISLTDIDLNESCTKEQMLDMQSAVEGMGLTDCRVWRSQNSQASLTDEGAAYADGLLISYTGTQARIRPYDITDGTDTIGIGDDALKDNQTVEYFAVCHSDMFTTIGAQAFMNSALKGVDLFDSVTTIGDRAFANCTQLEELTIPDSVTTIGEEAFMNCTQLEELTIPDSVISIGTGAFDGLTGLKRITILCDASVLPDEAFGETDAEIRVSADATDEQVAQCSSKLNCPWYAPVLRVGEESSFVTMPFNPTPAENFEFNPETGLISAYTGTETDVVVPREIDGVTVVGFENYNVFESCRDYTATDMENNVTEWVHLRSVVLPETIKELPDSLFEYCQQLETFVCYAPLQSTGRTTFMFCKSLKNVIFVNGLREIDNYAFDNAGSLENLYFGEQLLRIGQQAFGYSGLTSFVADAETIESNVFVDCQSLTDLHFTSKVKSIGEYLVTDCPNLSVVCFDGCDLTASEMGLFCNIAPELTVYVPENMNEENLNHAENCISWNSSETAVTVTVGTCTHALPEKPDISSLLPDLEPAEADDDPDLT